MEKDRIGVSDIIREMRQYVEDDKYDPDVAAWITCLEAAMREPVATIIEAEDGFRYCDWDSALETGTKLYAFPPDATGEIERLDGLCVQAIDLMKKKDAEIERLKVENIDLERSIDAIYGERNMCEQVLSDRDVEIEHLRFIVKMLLHYIDTGDMRELDLRIARAALAKEEDK